MWRGEGGGEGGGRRGGGRDEKITRRHHTFQQVKEGRGYTVALVDHFCPAALLFLYVQIGSCFNIFKK